MMTRALTAVLLTGVTTIAAHAGVPVVQNFEVTLKLSAQLIAELSAKNETIIVNSVYYGDPNESGAADVDEMGVIQLGEERTEVPPADTTIPVNAIADPAKLAMIEGGAKVNVNVFTGRKSSGDNLISCDFIDGPISELIAAPTEISCGLITENPVTMLKPAKS